MKKQSFHSQEEIVYNENVVPDDVIQIDLETSATIHSQQSTGTHASKNVEINEKIVENVVQDPDLPKAEGLHAWLVIFCTFLCNAITYGIGTSCNYVCVYVACLLSSGVMQAYYDEEVFYHSVSSVQLTFVGTLMYVSLNFVSPVVHVVKSILGPKITLISGTIVLSLSLILAGFSTKIWHLYLTQGIMYGLGGSLMYTTAMGIAPQWFDKRRGLALGVATGGSGIGGLIMPFIMNPLLENLGAAWCYRVLGFLALAVGLFASIFIKERYPVQQHRKFSDLLDFSLLKQPNFVIWNIACDLCLLGYMVPFYLLPTYAEYYGLSPSQGANLISVVSAFNFIGRVLSGFIADYVGRLNADILSMTLSGLACGILWVYAKNYGVLIAFCVIYGLVCGAYFALLAPVTALITGIERFPSGFSLLLVINGIGYFGAPIAGAVQSATNSNGYLATQMFSTVTFLLGALIMFVLKIKMSRSLFTKI